jgi:hypothetical protein
MSFLKSLFGGGTKAAAPSGPGAPVQTVEHEGYLIEATPYLEGGQYQVAGTISKEIGGERKVHKFIRADRTPTVDDAAEMSIRKAKQIIEQAGERMFG